MEDILSDDGTKKIEALRKAKSQAAAKRMAREKKGSGGAETTPPRNEIETGPGHQTRHGGLPCPPHNARVFTSGSSSRLADIE